MDFITNGTMDKKLIQMYENEHRCIQMIQLLVSTNTKYIALINSSIVICKVWHR